VILRHLLAQPDPHHLVALQDQGDRMVLEDLETQLVRLILADPAIQKAPLVQLVQQVLEDPGVLRNQYLH